MVERLDEHAVAILQNLDAEVGPVNRFHTWDPYAFFGNEILVSICGIWLYLRLLLRHMEPHLAQATVRARPKLNLRTAAFQPEASEVSSSVLFSGRHYVIHAVRCNQSRSAIVYFDYWRPSPSLEAANPLENFLRERRLNGFCILAAANDWFQDPEIFEAFAVLHAAAPSWRLVGFGGSMGAYGLINHYHDLKLVDLIAVTPQFSVQSSKVPYEIRWRDEAARINFHHDQIESLQKIRQGCIVFDPLHVDALHVRDIQFHHSLQELRLPFGGHDQLGMLSQCALLSEMLVDMVISSFDAAKYRQKWRLHRRHSPIFWLGLAEYLMRKRNFGSALRAIKKAPMLSGLALARGDELEAEARAGLALEAEKAAVPIVEKVPPAAIGHIDLVEPSGLVSGWCAAVGPPFLTRHVTILVDGVPALRGIPCVTSRPDLRGAGFGDGTHGFTIQLAPPFIVPGQPAELRLHDDATGSEVGNPVHVMWAAQISVARQFEAHIDGISPAGLVSGWCYDCAAPARTIEVGILVDGKPVGNTRADLFRKDLQLAGKGTGVHGFVFALPLAMLPVQLSYAIGLCEAGSNTPIDSSLLWQRPLTTDVEGRLAALERRVSELAAMPPVDVSNQAGAALRIVWISGEKDTPGHIYRVLRMAEAARGLGHDAIVIPIEEALSRVDEMRGARFIVIWRAPLTYELRAVIEIMRRGDATILFDIDDLMVEPGLARADVIDAIRSEGYNEEHVRHQYQSVRDTALLADATIVTTQELGFFVQTLQKPVHVVPNGFDDATLRRGRLAFRRRRTCVEPETLVRIGYAGGSRTHQRDFALAVPALARLLKQHAHCRLVLFRHAGFDKPLVELAEYPELTESAQQIEWRDMVSLDELPDEIARFDINLAPLEVGNPFCEAKSELKFFEGAIAGVPTIASPTGPFSRAIRDGETGLLAADDAGWETGLRRLVMDTGLRRRIAQNAYFDVLYRYGPERRQDLLDGILMQLNPGRDAARAFELALRRHLEPLAPLPHVPEHQVIRAFDRGAEAAATVIIPLYNYQDFVKEALDSVWHQDIDLLDLVVIDDCSTDHSLRVVREWIEHCGARFNRVLLLKNLVNSGLGFTRNVGFAAAETRFVLPVDADNRLLPSCISHCLQSMANSGAAFAYPKIHQFGEVDSVMGGDPFHAARLAAGNFIDAMALISKTAWAAVGGYNHVRFGWEDYDFWCRLVARGFWGKPVNEILAQYRVHTASMLRTSTDVPENKRLLIEDFGRRHPWVMVPQVTAAIRFSESLPHPSLEATPPEPKLKVKSGGRKKRKASR